MRSIFISTLLILLTTMPSCAQYETFDEMASDMSNHDVPLIKNEEIKNITDNEEVVFLDAREKEEFNISHIRNAIHVGYDNFELESVEGIDKNKKVVVYCSVGYRSGKVGEQLKEAGFKNVYNLYGGIFGWVNAGNEVVNNDNEKTPNIHAYNEDWGKWLKKGKKVY